MPAAPWERDDQVVAPPAAPWEANDAPVTPKRNVGAGSVAVRAGKSALNNAIAYTQMPVVGAVELADIASNLILGTKRGALTTAYGDTFVQPNLNTVEAAALKPGENAGPIGNAVMAAAPGIGKMAGDLAQGAPVGAAYRAATQVPGAVVRGVPAVVQALREGAATGIPAAARVATEKQAELTHAGVNPLTAAVPAAVSGLTTMGQFALPASAGSAAATLPARVASRGVQGAALNVPAGVVQRQIDEAMLPAQARPTMAANPYDLGTMVADAIGGILFGQMGSKGETFRAPNREALGYKPDPTIAPIEPPSPPAPPPAVNLDLVPKNAEPITQHAPDPTKAPIAPDWKLEGEPEPPAPARPTVADQVAQDDLAAAVRQRVAAEDAFKLAQRRQEQADRSLRREGEIQPDYQGDGAAFKPGEEPTRRITLLDNERPVMVEGDGEGGTRVIWQNDDGTYTKAVVDQARLRTVEQPVAVRRAQDFQERSSEPPAGVGRDTMESERMPRRSTDRIAGDEAGGRAEPYDPNPREAGDGEYQPRGENRLPGPEREPVQFEGNAPRLEVNDAGRANTDSARDAGPGAGPGRPDGAVNRESGAAPRNADAGQGQAPAGAGRVAAENGRNPRVAEARDVPRLQVNYEKAVTQAKRVATALRNLLASENPDAAKVAGRRDQLAKLRASIADMAERLTPERLPTREKKGDSMLTAIRQAGGVTKELAKDIGLDKPDVKLRAGKLKSEDALVDALYDKGWLTHDEYLSPDAYKIATEKIGREVRGESADGRTEADLERQARAREREELEADARRYGIDTRDMTRDQVADAVNRAEQARMDEASREEANAALREAAEAEREGTLDDLLDEVGVTEKEREDAKWRREGAAESKAAADEARVAGDRGEADPAQVRREGPADDGRGRPDDERAGGEPGNGEGRAGPGEGDGGAGEARPPAGKAGGSHPDPRYRLNALPLDAAWDAAKRIMGDGRAWADYVKFLKEATSDIAERLKSPRKALADLKEGMTTKTRQNGIAAAVRYLNEDIGRRARIIVDKFDSPTARKVVDMMDFEMGKGEGTQGVFRESMLRRLNVAFNNLKPTMDLASRIIDSVSSNGKTRKEAYSYVWEEIIKRVENPSLSRQGEIGAAVKAIEGWFKTMRDMQVEAGVDIGDQGPTYFTVKYDADKIVEDTKGFIRDATRAYQLEGLDATEAAAKAEALALAKVRGGSFSLVGLETGASNSVTKERVFSKPEALEVMRRWRNLDGREVLMSYAYSAAQRAAIAERFGDNFGGTREKVMRDGKMVEEGKVLVPSWDALTKKITEEGAAETLPMLRQLVELGTGVNRPTGEGPHAADVFRNVMTMAALEKSVLPNMMEAVTPLATTNGNAAAALSLMRSNLQALASGVGLLPKSQRRAATQRLLEGLGAISDIGANALAMARYSGADTGKGVLSEVTAKFFEGIGLTRLEDTNRITAGDVGAVWFDSLAKSITGDGGWRSITKGADAKYLRDFGIPAGKEQAFAEYVRSLGGRIPTVEELVKAGEMGKLYGTALNRFVHTTVQHADALTRPSWASSPWGSLVFQFSSYTYAFHKNVIRKAFNNAMDAVNPKSNIGAADRLSLATSMVPGFMLMGAASALTMWLRDELFNELSGTKKNLTDEAKAERAVLNANLLGKYGRIFEQFGQQRWGGVGGFAGLVTPPSVAQTAKAADSVVRGMMDESKGNSAERKAWKAVYNTVLEPAWQIALSAGPGIPFGVASVGLRTLAPSAGEGLFVDEMAGPERKKRREKPQKGVLEQVFD